MKICVTCGKQFANAIVVNGKRHNVSSRKRCLDCSPFGTHNTSRMGSPRTGDVVVCRICKKEYRMNKLKGHILTTCNNCESTTRKFKMKQRCLEYMGGKCEVCGYSRCSAAMDFHHRDESQKSFTIACCYSRSWDALRKELDKCVLLCANCHRELHYTGKNVAELTQQPECLSYKEEATSAS